MSNGQGANRDRPTIRMGVARRPLADIYHFLLTSPWWVLFGLILAAYLGANLLFAGLYVADGGVENARPGSFRDAYFFSVQTMATIGYGKMVPVSTFANVVVTVEALFGLVALAFATGLMFAKFSQPRARVLFSDKAVVSVRDGASSLMVRLANERATGLVEAQVSLVFARDERTREGEDVRRFHTLPLVRARNAVFALSWTVVHPLDEASPLFGETSESLKKTNAILVLSLVGIEEATAQTVHSRHTWLADEIHFDHRFRDILKLAPNGRRTIDYALFHDVERVKRPPT
jgi:inward rectifier potassium channel